MFLLRNKKIDKHCYPDLENRTLLENSPTKSGVAPSLAMVTNPFHFDGFSLAHFVS